MPTRRTHNLTRQVEPLSAGSIITAYPIPLSDRFLGPLGLWKRNSSATLASVAVTCLSMFIAITAPTLIPWAGVAAAASYALIGLAAGTAIWVTAPLTVSAVEGVRLPVRAWGRLVMGTPARLGMWLATAACGGAAAVGALSTIAVLDPSHWSLWVTGALITWGTLTLGGIPVLMTAFERGFPGSIKESLEVAVSGSHWRATLLSCVAAGVYIAMGALLWYFLASVFFIASFVLPTPLVWGIALCVAAWITQPLAAMPTLYWLDLLHSRRERSTSTS